jgi:hypothetical protein
MDNPEMVMPDVVARPELYRLGDPEVDARCIAAIRKAAEGGPNTRITVYRAAPKGISGINPGDWVTPSRKYAEDHGIEEIEAGDWAIYTRTVRAGDLFTEGNSIAEWGWEPEVAA